MKISIWALLPDRSGEWVDAYTWSDGTIRTVPEDKEERTFGRPSRISEPADEEVKQFNYEKPREVSERTAA